MTRAEARKQLRRGNIAAAVATLIGAITLAVIVTALLTMSRDLRYANKARDQLAQQVQGLGASPVAGPPGSRGEPGAVGPSGPSGPPGPTGPSGSPGHNGSPGSPGPSGSPGRPGDDGSNATGAPGAPGTPGANGVQGPQGPAGPAGQDGADGKDGTDGRDGQTCPDGYSLQAPAYDPDALVCRKDGAPDPTPSQSGLNLLGMAATRRRIA